MLKNFTILTPGCRSRCKFCVDPMNYKTSTNHYTSDLAAAIDQLPDDFVTLSISGGEPTEWSGFNSFMQALKTKFNVSKRFERVVLTTNGSELITAMQYMVGVVDHINISRHGIGEDANFKVFHSKNIARDAELIKITEFLNANGIDVNLNHVYDEASGLTPAYVKMYVKYAKLIGANSVTFRYDQNLNSLEPTYLEKQFPESSYPVLGRTECPVCRSHLIKVDDMNVTFKASFAEPAEGIDGLYELIYHPVGGLTTDWAGLNPYVSPMTAEEEMYNDVLLTVLEKRILHDTKAIHPVDIRKASPGAITLLMKEATKVRKIKEVSRSVEIGTKMFIPTRSVGIVATDSIMYSLSSIAGCGQVSGCGDSPPEDVRGCGQPRGC